MRKLSVDAQIDKLAELLISVKEFFIELSSTRLCLFLLAFDSATTAQWEGKKRAKKKKMN
jgi:hypothetical protein